MQIFTGDVLADRKSKFQAYLARVTSVHEVQSFCETLRQNNKIAKATHNILAYRVGTDCGHDSDGEDQAGRGLQVLLNSTQIDDIALVVTRWYGGIHLGSDRFRLINRAARELLHKHRLIHK